MDIHGCPDNGVRLWVFVWKGSTLHSANLAVYRSTCIILSGLICPIIRAIEGDPKFPHLCNLRNLRIILWTTFPLN